MERGFLLKETKKTKLPNKVLAIKKTTGLKIGKHQNQ